MATPAQLGCIRRLSGELGRPVPEPDRMTKSEAINTIGTLYREKKDVNGKVAAPVAKGKGSFSRDSSVIEGKPAFSMNFRADSGAWQVARMTPEEEERLRALHFEHCKKVMSECMAAGRQMTGTSCRLPWPCSTSGLTSSTNGRRTSWRKK